MFSTDPTRRNSTIAIRKADNKSDPTNMLTPDKTDKQDTTAITISANIAESICAALDPIPPDFATNQPSVTTLTEFHFFPALPQEIRDIIWLLTLHPRIVEIYFHPTHGFHSRAPLPTTLGVSKESRKIALPHYPICFGSSWYPALTRFSFPRDTLYFAGHLTRYARLFFASLRDFETNNLQAVALDEDIPMLERQSPAGYELFKGICRALERMPKLVVLFDVVENGRLGDYFDFIDSGDGACPIEFFEELPPRLHHAFAKVELTLGAVQDRGAKDYWEFGRGSKLAFNLPAPRTVLGVRKDFCEFVVARDGVGGK